MKPKRSLVLLTALICLNLIACDPEEIARRKTPAPIKSALTFTEAPKEGSEGKRKGRRLAKPELEIISPSQAGVYPVGRQMVFEAKASNREGMPPRGKELVWTAVNLETKQKMVVGNGIKVVKELAPGPYQVSATMLYDKMRVKEGGRQKVKYKHMVKRVNFRIAMSISGRVISGGKGVKDAELILSDVTGEKILGQTKSDSKGQFSLEFPQNIVCRLVVRKPGYSFSPLHKVFEFQGDSETVVFKGAKATIKEIMLTRSPDSDKPVKDACPGEEVYFKAGYETDKRVRRVEVSLIQATPTGKIRELLGEAIEAADVPNTMDPNTKQALRVKIPDKLKTGIISDSYSLVVTYYDTEGNSFAGLAEEQIRVSPSMCARDLTIKGIEAQLNGEQQKAIDLYDQAEEYSSASPSSTESAQLKEIRLFDRGLAHLVEAIEAKPDSRERIAHINKSLADFAETLKLHRRDAEA
jgi:hypothetical protein